MNKGVCIQKGRACEFANQYGECMITGCITYKKEESPTWLGRECEICGKGTKDVNTHICDECKERLKKVLYE